MSCSCRVKCVDGTCVMIDRHERLLLQIASPHTRGHQWPAPMAMDVCSRIRHVSVCRCTCTARPPIRIAAVCVRIPA